MNIHKNARLTPLGRERIVKEVLSGQAPEAAARAAGVCPRTVRKCAARFEGEGLEGLKDRSSRPHRLYRPTAAAIVERVEALRRQRFTGKQIAVEVGVSPATVSRILKRLGLNGLAALEPAEPVRRYQRDHPGELIHIDIRSSDASTGQAIASQAGAPASPPRAAAAGNMSTSASMMPPGSLSPKSCLMSGRKALLLSSGLPLPTTRASASRWHG